MPLQAPNLDDRTFSDIYAEALTLIPRYSPEWTDFNDSDPGITLVQLFAWMTDLMIYRLNQVPERNYIKFLQLLGIEQMPAVPARADMTFTVSRPDVDSVIVPQGTQIAAQGPDGPLVFETQTGFVALGAKLKQLQCFDGFGYSVVTSKNAVDGQWYYPFGQRAREGSALLLGFDSAVAFTDQNVDLTIYLPEQDEPLAPLTCNGGSSGLALGMLPVAATLVWEYWDLSTWQPLTLVSDGTRALARDGHIVFQGPGAQVKKAVIGSIPDPLYWIRLRLAASNYELSPRVDTLLTNTTLALQAVTYRDEVLGRSNGRPNQSYTLANRPVVTLDKPLTVPGAYDRQIVIYSVRVEIDEGQGPLAWQEVDDFDASGPEDPHFVCDRNTGVITLGNGHHGRIPVAFGGPPDGNVIARLYMAGGGSQGMVAAGAISEIQTFLPGIDSATNLFAAYGGSDEESVEDAKLRAPAELKSKGRAVTAEDFETLAMATPSVRVRRAKALPLAHPNYPGASIPGSVTVIVVPDGDAPNPLPNAATLAAVCAYLDQHRLLTAEVHVTGPTYHLVRVSAQLIVAPDGELAQVQRDVQSALNNYFSPLDGGAAGTGWPFGGTIFFSDVYRIILAIPGVARIADGQLVIYLDGEPGLFGRDVPICPGELVYSTDHDVQVAYATAAGA
jgi:predicted phage baseplate assembly protein